MNEFEQVKPTVLYVDDEDLARKYFVRALGGEYEIFTASGADAAIEVLRNSSARIDILVTDFRMPARDGGDLLRQIELEFPHIVRILVTAYADKNLLLETVNAGELFKILEKPLDLRDVKLALQQASELARVRNERDSRLRAMEETLSFLAHELNTPLAAISNFSRGIQRRANEADIRPLVPIDIERAALRVHDNARYCMSVLSAFVDSVQQTRMAGHDGATSAVRLVNSLLDAYPLTHGQRSLIRCDFQQDFPVGDSPNCVALALSSILANALRATPEREGAYVLFSVLVDTHAQIRITDNGEGIPAHVLDHLLEDPVTTHADVGGSGWGLIFCKRIMQSFGGGVRVQSEVGKSTTITLDFPYLSSALKRNAQ